jgi:DNA modification methylase
VEPTEILSYFENRVFLGDCLDVLRFLPDNSVDLICTDPPYGLGNHEPTVEEILHYLKGERLDTGGDFMGKEWDIPSVPVWKECFRVLKPGGHVFSFGGTRTWDLISLGLRAAGFEMRDTIKEDHPAFAWVHGQGFPKSLNIGKAIDKMKGAERTEVIGKYDLPDVADGRRNKSWECTNTTEPGMFGVSGQKDILAPVTQEATQWEGWGTALKPSWEPILVFRKPVDGTVAENALKYGTGGLNIEATRVKHASKEDFEKHKAMVDRLKEQGGSLGDSWKNSSDLSGANEVKTSGRWPPNMVMAHADGCKKTGMMILEGDHRTGDQVGGRRPPGFANVGADTGDSRPNSAVYGDEQVPIWKCVDGCPIKALDEQSGTTASGAMRREVPAYEGESTTGFLRGRSGPSNQHGDSGGASRFFPQFEGQTPPEAPFLYTAKVTKREATLEGEVPNKHPTKKPLTLIQWLLRLGCPKGGIVLDPYIGSGTTAVAAIDEGMRFIGIEKDTEFYPDTVKRVEFVVGKDEYIRRDIFDEIMGDG